MLKEVSEEGGCAGCHGPITDRFYLLAADRQWHLGCLQCAECKLALDTELTCYFRHGNIYCKHDYYRLFSCRRCSRCGMGISSSELVMRARDEVFHLHCFSCTTCGVLLTKGDTFGMRGGALFCRPHYDPEEPPLSPAWGPRGRPRKRKLSSPEPQEHPLALTHPSVEVIHSGDLSSSMESLTYESSVTSPSVQQQRTKRMRTSFKHHQLRTMKSYFAINQNPDAKDLKQLAQKTGLSKRVLQVWFQNARAKWRRNLMRQEGGGAASSAPPLIVTETVTSLEDLRHHQALQFGDIY
nr:LIM/homeobox protein Lhx9-like isoform X2 [Halyomorpha halys]